MPLRSSYVPLSSLLLVDKIHLLAEITGSSKAWAKIQELLLTALSSPKLPHFAKCLLKLALLLPAATPQSALSTPAVVNADIIKGLGNAGLAQSNTMAVSLNMSAANRHILHSGSKASPNLCAKAIVARRPMESWSTERRRAAVGEAEASPTPTEERTAREANNPATELAKACSESYIW